MGLGTLANIAEIFSAVFVVTGIVFGLIQIRQWRQERLEANAAEVMRAIQQSQFSRALRTVLAMPACNCVDDMRACGEECEDAAMQVSLTLETVGIMVHRGLIPLELVHAMIGGSAISSWKRLKGWCEATRTEADVPRLHEWYQWLCEQLEAYEPPQGPGPAYNIHRDWKPPRR
jgi:hypothetical protein